MKAFEVLRIMIFALPLGIFATFGVFTVVTSTMKVRRIDVILRSLLCFYFSCAVISSALFLAYYFFYDIFAWFDIIYCAAVVFTMVLFHHFLCFAVQSEKRFSPLHYIIPALVCCALYAVKLSLPGHWTREGSTLIFCNILIYAVIYSLLSVLEMHRFHVQQSIANGTPEAIDRSRAILFILEVLMFPICFGLLPFFGGQRPDLIVSILLMVSILTALTMNIPLTYAIIRHYTLSDGSLSLFDQLTRDVATARLEDNLSGLPEGGQAAGVSRPAKRIYRNYTRKHRTTGQLIEIDKTEFENYFRKHKPYLNPNLSIGDLVESLHSNRTYISKFVNRIYGMNFSSYINMCRLRELERLMAAPGNRHKTPAVLYSQAGFGSYRSYLNAKKQYEINTI